MNPLVSGWIVLVVLVLASPGEARALGCCVGSPALTDRVALWESFVVSFAATGDVGFARASGLSITGVSGTDASAGGTLSLLGRVSPAWSAWLVSPALVTFRGNSGSILVGGGVGDLDLGGRFEDDALGPWSFGARLTIPSGRATPDSTAPLAVDVTGRGFAALRLGAWGDWTYANGWFTTWVSWVGGGVPVSATAVAAEVTLDSAVVVGRYLPGGHSLALAAREGLAWSFGRVGTGFRHKLGVVASGAWAVGGPVTLVASLFTDVHAVDDVFRAGASVGVRAAW